jgi:hypothetical protein
VAGVNERTLKTGGNSDPDTQVAAFGDGKLLAVYLDDVEERSVYNSTAAFYTVYDTQTQTWSEPRIIEDDGTFDKTPVICRAGERFLVAWASSNEVFSTQPDTLTALRSTDTHARFFDFEKGDFSSGVINVTKTTAGLYEDAFADTEPQAAYYKDEQTGNEKLLIYYTKSEYEATGSDGKATTGDALYPYSVIAYRRYDITSSSFEDYNESVRVKTVSNFKWYYNRYLSYFKNSENSIYVNAYDTYVQAVNNYHLGRDTVASCLTAEAGMYNILQNRIAEEMDSNELGRLNTLARYRSYMGWDIDPEAEWGDYCSQMYGQRFLDLAPNVIISETLDENGYWIEGTGVAAADSSSVDPLVTESEVIAYNGLGLYAYVMDFDGKTSTTTDRDVFLQIYDFYKGTFTHPIMLTSSPELGERELAFVRAADTTFLTYLTDGADGNEASGNSTAGVKDTSGGSIMAFDVTSNISDGAYRKAQTGSGREYYYFDKSRLHKIQ